MASVYEKMELLRLLRRTTPAKCVVEGVLELEGVAGCGFMPLSVTRFDASGPHRMHEPRDDHSAILLRELAQFTGDLERFKHALNRRLLFTPGVRHLAERAGCYWLVDAVASWIGSREFTTAARRDPRIRDIHFWRLVVATDRSAMLTAVADSGEEPFVRQAIAFTDFQLTEIDLYCAFDGVHWTVMLPTEY